MINYGDLHPITVHFPVVLITVAVILDIASQMTRNKMIYSLAGWFVIATAISLIPTIATGFEASHRFGGQNTYVNMHMSLGLMAFFCVWVNCLIRVFYFLEFPVFHRINTIVLNILGFALLFITGDVGGVLSHGKPLFGETKPETVINYYSTNSSQARSAKADALGKILEKEIDVRDVAVIFKNQKCASCHNSFFDHDLPNFSKEVENLRPWLLRDPQKQLLKWEESPFYTIVLQRNRMPYDEHHSPIGLSPSERLTLLRWLKNGAPEEMPPTDIQDADDNNSE